MYDHFDLIGSKIGDVSVDKRYTKQFELILLIIISSYAGSTTGLASECFEQCPLKKRFKNGPSQSKFSIKHRTNAAPSAVEITIM